MTQSLSRAEAAAGRVSLWRGKDVKISPLSGGLTNENYLVEAGRERYVMRIPGTSMSAETLQSERMVRRMAESFKRLHAASPFLKAFDMFRLIEAYLQIVEEHQVRIPADYRQRLPLLAEIERAVRVGALPNVSCHNDLLCENFIDDGQCLRIVDYELSGNNDACFDLGNTAQEASLDDELRAVLCGAYFGRLDRQQLARMNLFALMSDVGWTLWGAIQAKISTLDFDFTDYYTT